MFVLRHGTGPNNPSVEGTDSNFFSRCSPSSYPFWPWKSSLLRLQDPHESTWVRRLRGRKFLFWFFCQCRGRFYLSSPPSSQCRWLLSPCRPNEPGNNFPQDQKGLLGKENFQKINVLHVHEFPEPMFYEYRGSSHCPIIRHLSFFFWTKIKWTEIFASWMRIFLQYFHVGRDGSQVSISPLCWSSSPEKSLPVTLLFNVLALLLCLDVKYNVWIGTEHCLDFMKDCYGQKVSILLILP